MRVAIVTPYFKEADHILAQCHDSVLAQSAACTHVLVADGHPNPVVDGWDSEHIILPGAHADGGNTPRVLGSISAFNRGFDAVAFLDADNWLRPDHVARLLALHRSTGADICTTGRSMHRLDGSHMFDDDKNDGRTHVDTSCYFLTRAALPLLSRWLLIPRGLANIVDTVYWESILGAKLSHAHDPATTVCYRTSYEADYSRLGEAFPQDGKSLAVTDAPFAWFGSLPAAERFRIWKQLGWPVRTRSVARLRMAHMAARVTRLTRGRAVP